MFIKSLRLLESETDATLREVQFRKGANFVVDVETGDRHNKVGKTTFLKCIDILMGASEKKALYFDTETNSTNHVLANFIKENKVAVEGIFAEDFSPLAEVSEVTLKVELFPRGKSYINGEKITQPNYRHALKRIFFRSSEEKPTFRQLVNSFVRISLARDNTTFFRNLERESNSTYRSIYNFLFRFSDPDYDVLRDQLQKERRADEAAKKRFMQLHDVRSTEEQRQILDVLERRANDVAKQISFISSDNDFKNLLERASVAQREYVKIADILNEVDYQIDMLRAGLDASEEERRIQGDVHISKEFYEEVGSLVPEIHATFEQMLEFNRRLTENKISHFESVLRDYLTVRETNLQNQERLKTEVDAAMEFFDSSQIDLFEEKNSELAEWRSQIGYRKSILDTLEIFEKGLEEQSRAIEELEAHSQESGKGEETYRAPLNLFNSIFSNFAKRINEETPVLIYSPDSEEFPLALTALQGTSTGTRKSLVAAYDLAYQEFAKRSGIDAPKFVVHDVLESVEGKHLSEVFKVAEEVGCQFIVAILKEKLDSSGLNEIEQERSVILELSSDNLLFEGSR